MRTRSSQRALILQHFLLNLKLIPLNLFPTLQLDLQALVQLFLILKLKVNQKKRNNLQKLKLKLRSKLKGKQSLNFYQPKVSQFNSSSGVPMVKFLTKLCSLFT